MNSWLKLRIIVLVVITLIIGLLAMAGVGQAQGNTWHVALNGSDVSGDGSEANPFATIQHGIDVASPGDTVLVHAGTYPENINFKGKNIVVGSLFITTGDEAYIAQTVIDGNRNGRVVTFENGEDATALLSGFTITNGYAQGSRPENSGGGIGCFTSSPTLTHLKVSDNEATNEGGGLYFVHCASSLRNSTVANNIAFGGGGIRYSYGSPILENVVVAGNSAGSSGGGLFFYHADASVKNTLIVNNVAHDVLIGDGGGGLYFDGCSPSFVNVTIVGNSTAGGGGGLHVSFSSQPSLTNAIVWGNSPEQIYFDTDWGGEAITVEYSDVQGGEAGIVTNGQGPVYWLAGNIDADPLFAGMEGDYHLSDNSPAIGAGTLDNAPNTDIEGNPRPNPAGSNPDMGAYEHPLSVPNVNEAQGKLYILESGGLLYRMNLDGSGGEIMRRDLSEDNAYITLDPAAGVAYVTRWSRTNQIGRANLDGTGSVAYLYDGESDGGQGIALDVMAGKVYWGLYYHGVYAANMDRTGSWTKLVDASALWPGHGQRGQLQVDVDNQHVYFRTAQNGPCGDCPGRKIWRVNFDGSDLTPVYQVGNGDALALDLVGNKMYFSDGPPVNAQPNNVVRTNLDGSNVAELLTLSNPYRYLRTIALDVAGGKMYMSVVNPDSGWRDWAIMRANLDGSGLETLYTWTGSDQAAIALDLSDSSKKTIFLPIIIK